MFYQIFECCGHSDCEDICVCDENTCYSCKRDHDCTCDAETDRLREMYLDLE